jgi:OTU domain-containing protein 6
MERDLKARHESELAAANNTGSRDIPNTKDGHVTEEELEDEISPDKLLEQLALDVSTPADTEPAPREQQQPQKKGPKKNRQKDRLARKKAAIDQMTAEAALEAAKIPDLRKIELENIKALTDKLGLIQYDVCLYNLVLKIGSPS